MYDEFRPSRYIREIKIKFVIEIRNYLDKQIVATKLTLVRQQMPVFRFALA